MLAAVSFLHTVLYVMHILFTYPVLFLAVSWFL